MKKILSEEEKERLAGYENQMNSYTERRYKYRPMLYYSKLRSNKILGIIRDHFQLTRNISILDVGCGTGIQLEELANRSDSFVFSGLDFSPTMIKEAQARLSYIYLNHNLYTNLKRNRFHC